MSVDAIERAAKALRDVRAAQDERDMEPTRRAWDDLTEAWREDYREQVRAVLKAAGE